MESGHNTVDSNDKDNAIPSWSGFDYQGQVSIYYALKKINQIDLATIGEYDLQIESLEDFSINYNNEPISIHQVKAYPRNPNISVYKRPIFDLLGKAAKYTTISSCYLHTLIHINAAKDNALKTALQQIIPTKKKIQFQEFSKLLFEEEKYEGVSEKLIFNKSSDEEIKSVIGRLEIEKEIKEQIKIFLDINSSMCKHKFLKTEENYRFLYLNFIHELNRMVASGHQEETTEIKISFSKIVSILTTEYVFKYSEKIAASSLKNSISIYFDDYCVKEELYSDDQCTVWNEKWKWILKQNDNDFLLLCKKISPTTNIDFKNLEPEILKDFVVKAGAHKTFFPLILGAERFSLQIEGLKEIFVLENKGIHHLITTIAETWGKNEVENQGKKIYKSLKDDNKLAEILYDVQVFITNELDGEFDGKIIDPSDDYKETFPDIEIKENIVQPKKMSFMNIIKAKDVFIS